LYYISFRKVVKSGYVCEECGLELQVVKECEECGTSAETCECKEHCRFECCGEPLKLKAEA
jgi:hypothetical protein